MKKPNSSNYPSIVIIGSGNLASHIIDVFLHNNINILQIYSRSDYRTLEDRFKGETEIINDLKVINQNADIYFTIVSDDAISTIADQWPFLLSKKQIITHCSGSVSFDVFDKIAMNKAVFWPIQTIRKHTSFDWKTTPLCITTNNTYCQSIIGALAELISDRVEFVTEDQRIKLHLTAVILNNFSNHLYSLADQFLVSNNLNLDLFIPILEETIHKLKDNKPKDLQTGPASRNDQSTIHKHIKLLEEDIDLQLLYKTISNSIIKSNE